MFYEAQRASHFQFWILNSLEYRINEVDRKVKKIEKILTKDQGVKKDIEEKNAENIDIEQQKAE